MDKKTDPSGNCFLACSTHMSFAVSLAGVTIDQTKMSFEHVLLDELGGKKMSLNGFTAGIGSVKERLLKIKIAVASLRHQMHGEGYVDQKTIHSTEIHEAGKRMAASGMVSWGAFETALGIYRSESFYAVLNCFDDHVDKIYDLTKSLQSKAEICAGAFGRGKLETELDENRAGNLRPEFARLYTAWSRFNEFFLASAMVSTEAYYMANGYGSLAPVPEVEGATTPA